MRNKNFDFKFGIEQKEEHVQQIKKPFNSEDLKKLKDKTRLNHKE